MLYGVQVETKTSIEYKGHFVPYVIFESLN